MLIANASRLTEIECHSPNLINTDLSECTKLQRIDLSDCTALGTGIGAQPILNIQNCNYLRSCNCSNTKLTAIYTKQAGGNLEEIYYPETTQVVQLTNQTHLSRVGIPYGYIKDLLYNIKLKKGVRWSNGQIIDSPNDGHLYGINDFFKIYPTSTYTCLNAEAFYIYEFTNDKQYIGARTVKEKEVYTPSSDDIRYIKVIFRYPNKPHIYQDDDRSFYNCQSLATVQISNCKNIKTLGNENDLNFNVFKYVQSLTIDNALDDLKSVTFAGFSKLKTVNLSTLSNLEKLGFEDMLPSSDISTLENITVSNCPLISTLSFNVSSDAYKVAFVQGGKMDIGGMYSLTKIESNTDIIGLNTLIIPTSLKELKFTNEYGEGINDLKSIWSASANHSSDGFVGIDFKDINLTYINMASLKIERGINFHITPTIQHPHLNTYRDGKTVPYFRPEGTMDLTNYTGEMGSMYKGIDFTKLTVTTPPNTNEFIYDISHLFEGAIFNKNLVNVVNEINKYPRHNGDWSCMFKDSVSDLESTDVEIPTDKPMILTSMYENTSVSKDIDLPSNVTNVDYMFKDCENVSSYKENWLKTYDNELSHIDVYKNTANDRIVPVDWGGKGYTQGYVSKIVVEIPTDNYEFILTTEPDYHIIGSRIIDWGDGTEEILIDGYSHIYERKGKYTILGSFVLGNTKAPSESIQECLTEVYMMADSVSDLSRAFQGCNNLKVLDFDTSHVTNMQYMFSYCSSLTELDLSNFNTTNVTDMGAMFYGCSNLTSLDLSNFNTSNVTNMYQMFRGCSKLTSLDLSNWNTENVTTMTYMFYNCIGLTELNLSNFNTTNVTSMYYMFAYCKSLTELNVSSFNTENVTTMEFMFNGCSNLTELNISSFDTSHVINMQNMFNSCSSLTSLDLSIFDTSNVTNTTYMFQSCSNLTELDLSNWNTSKVINMLDMFSNCRSLTELDLSNFDTSNVTNMQGMFSNCRSLTELDLSNFDTSNVTNMQYMFYDCTKLKTLTANNMTHSNPKLFTDAINNGYITELIAKNWTITGNSLQDLFKDNATIQKIDLSDWKNENVTNMSYMFFGCSKLTELDLFNFNTEKVTVMNNMFTYCSSLTELDVSNFNTSNVTNMTSTFSNCSKLVSLDLSNFDTSNVMYMYQTFIECSSLTELNLSNWNTKSVTNMNNMFSNCSSLTSLNVSSFDTKNVTNMQNMFRNCSSLTELDLSNFNTKNVTTMQNMFNNCFNLTELDVSNFNTSNVTNMEYMFYNCSSLTELDVSNFNTSNVTTMNGMFSICSNLTELNVSNFNTKNVTTIREMFYGCKSLTSLNLSSFDTENVTDMSYMFYGCSKLTSLDLSDWNTSNVTTMKNMFYNCSSLTELDLSNFDTSNVVYMDGMFNSCSKITNIEPPINLFISHNISSMIYLTREELLQWLNALSEITTNQTLTLGSTLSMKLREADLSIATNKGWSIA